MEMENHFKFSGRTKSMDTESTLEQRLAELEAAVRELQGRLDSQSPAPNWLERVFGSFKDEPAFEEVLEYGRPLRQADRPPEDAAP
jgi:hypothetical protein